MRILLAHHLPLEGSASGRATFDLAVGLREAGHQVECLVVDRERGPKKDDPSPVERVLCRPGDATADLPFDVPCLVAHAHSRQTFTDLSDEELDRYRDVLRQRLDERVARFDPHIIHCQHAWLLGHLALESGAPYVMTAHGPEFALAEGEPRFHRLVEQAVENTSRLLVDSVSLRDRALATFPEAEELIEVVPPPLDVRWYQPGLPSRASIRATLRLPDDGRPVIAFAGELAPLSGLETLLNAVAAVEARGQRLTLVLCGEGPDRDALDKLARRLRLSQVHFIDEIGRRDRATLLNLADAVVLPAPEFASPHVAIEALASGTPVVVPRGGPLAESIDDEFGGLVDSRDHELLAETLLVALDQNWKQSKGEKARRYALREHSLKQTSKRYVEIYRGVLERRFGQLHRE